MPIHVTVLMSEVSGDVAEGFAQLKNPHSKTINMSRIFLKGLFITHTCTHMFWI